MSVYTCHLLTGRVHGPSTSVYTAREQVTRVYRHYTAMYTACKGCLHGSYTSVHGPSTAVQTAVVRPRTGRIHGRVTCRVAAV